MISEKYVLEYGTDCLEMHVGAIERPGERVLITDDLVATGGTLCAAIRLLGTPSLNFSFMHQLHEKAYMTVMSTAYISLKLHTAVSVRTFTTHC